jgi:SAM-dependent methyltransferase
MPHSGFDAPPDTRQVDVHPTMNYEAVEQTIRAGYREITAKYRRDDEIEVNTRNHHRLSARLRALCTSFSTAISVLDAGCGTGRYFHCLRNVRELVGVDITEEMLRAAEHPVLEHEITVPNIQLVRANIYRVEFPPERFDFIYSLGMFGNGCPVTLDICNRFYEWLRPGGKLFFNTVDVAGLPWWHRLRREAKEAVYPMLPRRLKTALDDREAKHPFFFLSRQRLEGILRASRFSAFEITSHVCESPLWNGRHLECLAQKPLATS